MKKILQNKITLELLPKELNANYSICNFCHKQTNVNHNNERLSGKDKFFCTFCIRHNYHTKNNLNVLILSFRAILGFLYEEFYSGKNGRKIWLAQLKDYAAIHQDIGLENPAFSYDPETMYWFVDFLKVGESKKKIPLEEALKTIINILSCFNLNEIDGINMSKLYFKYKKALQTFKQNGFICIPTLKDCVSYRYNLESTKDFTLSGLT